MPPWGVSINFHRGASPYVPTTWKALSLNLSINTFVFTAYIKSGGTETKDNYSRGGVVEKRLRTTVLYRLYFIYITQ